MRHEGSTGIGPVDKISRRVVVHGGGGRRNDVWSGSRRAVVHGGGGRRHKAWSGLAPGAKVTKAGTPTELWRNKRLPGAYLAKVPAVGAL